MDGVIGSYPIMAGVEAGRIALAIAPPPTIPYAVAALLLIRLMINIAFLSRS